MDAKELTKEYTKLKQDYKSTKDTVDYLEQEVKKLRMIVDDLRWEIANLKTGRC
jgi:phage shock protein A